MQVPSTPTPRISIIHGIRSLFIQTEPTPNPESIKFLPGKPVIESDGEGGTVNGFYCTKQDKEEIMRSPLAKLVFDVEGVKSIYLGQDFITVTKYAEVRLLPRKAS